MTSSTARSAGDQATATTAIRDFATTKGTYVIQGVTVGEYLETLRLYDPRTRAANWGASLVQASFQRAIFPIHKNPIKRRMFRDLTRGGTLPPIVLYIRGEGLRVLIVDGLQRTDVLTQALVALLALERDEKLEDFAKEELDAMAEIGQKPLSVDEFLKRPVVLQTWKDLDMDELVRLFMVLNVGQQKVSPRHLLEVMGDQLREMFKNWGLSLLTEREEKEQPRKRRGSAAGDGVVPGLTHFRYEYLIDGLAAYVSRDPQVKTSSLLQKTDSPNLALEERITEIGSELCRADFVWVCRDLNEAIQGRYREDPKWRVAIQNSDNFFIPLMAALGDARHNQKARAALEDRKTKLIELIRTSQDADPLVLSRDTSDGLANILAEIRSNIGRKQRAVVYSAWRRYFRIGLEDPTYPIDWRVASLSE